MCEGNCVIEKGFESITIGAVERFITGTAFERGWVKPIRPIRERAAWWGLLARGRARLGDDVPGFADGTFDAEELPAAFGRPDLEVTRWATVKIERKNFMSGLPGVFAAGDIVRGASLIVWAIRDGRDAAQQIHAYVQQTTAVAVAAE